MALIVIHFVLHEIPFKGISKVHQGLPRIALCCIKYKKHLFTKLIFLCLFFCRCCHFQTIFYLRIQCHMLQKNKILVMSSFRLRKNLSIYDDLNLKHFDKKHLFKVKGFLLHFLNLCFWTLSVKFQDVLKP